MTAWPDLLALLAKARSHPSASDTCFSVRPLPRQRDGWIGCSPACGAAFLLRTAEGAPRQHAVSLPSLRVRHGIRVLIDDGSTRSEEVVSLLECLSNEAPTIELFVRCVGSIAASDAPLSASALATAVDRLLDLFRDFALASESELLGLWGELVLITHCPDPSRMVEQWRHSSTSRFDFGNDRERIDVKSTTSSLRHHELSFDQAVPPAGLTAAFVSIMTERVSSGTTIRDLWNRALALAPSQQGKIDATCVRSLGRDWQKAQEASFDLSRALTTLRVYPASAVPRFDRLPIGVLRARFVSDFERGTPWHGAPPTPDGPIAASLACATLDGSQGA